MIIKNLLESEKTDKDSWILGIDSQHWGNAAENAVKAYLGMNKINFSQPNVDVGGVDILVHKEEETQRAQIKKVCLKRNGTPPRDIYRFNFNRRNKRTEQSSYGPSDIDVFYHVMLTPLREVIWEIPSSVVPISDKSEYGENKFIHAKDWTINPKRKIQNELNLEDFIVSEKYSPELIMENISLFKNSLEMHLEAGEHLLRQGV